MKLLQYFLGSLSIILILNACSSSEEKQADISLTYFPLTVGNYWVYDVSEVTYDTLIQDIHLSYQERYEITDQFKSQLNEDIYVIYRSKRSNTEDEWTYDQTWTAKISNANEVIVTEENIPYVKMVFPIKEGSSWKGNKYNTIEEDRNNARIDYYTFQDFKMPFGDYSNTVTVQESNDLNLIYKDVRTSVYAQGLGLVYRIDNYIDYCDDSDCFGQYVRKHEHTKIQTLAAYQVQ